MLRQKDLKSHSGFSLLEVVIGIFIFVVGILALASLQGALTRSMADAKVHTVAVNLAEQQIERIQAFTQLQLPVPANPDIAAYNGIVDIGVAVGDPTMTIGPIEGVTYTLKQDVTDYYYNGDTFDTDPAGALTSDYKVVEITVTWDDDREFRLDEGSETTGNLDAESGIKVTTTIPPIITSAAARVAIETDGEVIQPSTQYIRTDDSVIPLELEDGTKYKESLSPEPRVTNQGSLRKTSFDVITYSQGNGQQQFLRREEFVVVPCECNLRNADSNVQTRRPVIWAGDEYTGGGFVTNKPYGVSSNNQQPALLCETCCRDHHDSAPVTGIDSTTDLYSNVYGPFRSDGEYSGTARASDHFHYQSDGTKLAKALTGRTSGKDRDIPGQDAYEEVCRLVRVDGYFRVAQDFRREDQFAFPQDFLDDRTDNSEVGPYSDYVTTAAAAYEDAVVDGYPTNSPPCIGVNTPDSCTTIVATPAMQEPAFQPLDVGELPSWTTVQAGGPSTLEQQLHSRGIYIDYVSDDLRDALACLKNLGDADSADSCEFGDVKFDKTGSKNVLEVIPFFDVQMTKLENWSQIQYSNPPIALTNEPVADLATNDRGRITQIRTGSTDVTTESHRGNIGFTNTLPIEPLSVFNANLTSASLNIQSLDASGSGGTGSGDPPFIIAGIFSEEVRGDPTIYVEGIGGVNCTREVYGYTCVVGASASIPALKVFGYRDIVTELIDKKTGLPIEPVPVAEPRYACSSAGGLQLPVQSYDDSNDSIDGPYTIFNLFGIDGILPAGTTYNITIQLTACGGGIG